MPITRTNERRDGKYKYRVRVNFTDQFGKHRQLERSTYGADEAKALEMKLRQQISTPENITKSMTVKQLYDECVASKVHDVRASTLDKFKSILEKHVLPTMADVKLSKLTVPAVQRWKDGINEKDLALKTRKNIFSAFRALIGYAVRMEYMSQNPLVKVGGFKDVNTIEKKIDFYTADEFKKFISAAKKEASKKDFFEWHYYVFFNIAFYTGARKGEIHALKWTDIEGSTLHITRSIAQKLKGGDRETPPKNKSSIRDVQLPTPLIKILEEHKKRCEKVPGFSEEWRICGGEKPLRDSSINNRNELYAKLANVKKIRIHDFRHSHASLLANEGINIQEVARRLGHSKIEMTWNTYSHLYPREEERALKVLNKIV